jgi:hypothetical protein
VRPTRRRGPALRTCDGVMHMCHVCCCVVCAAELRVPGAWCLARVARGAWPRCWWRGWACAYRYARLGPALIHRPYAQHAVRPRGTTLRGYVLRATRRANKN